MNYQLFHLINQLAKQNKLVDAIMLLFSRYIPYLFILMLVVILLYGLIKRDRKEILVFLHTFLFTLLTLFVGFIIGKVFYENRPFVTHHVNLLYQHVADASFPSDHALGTFSIALGLLLYRKKIGYLFLALSFVVGFSRIYVGQHYPLDIFGAFLICLILFPIYLRYLSQPISKLYIKVEPIIFKLIPFN